MTAFEFQAKFYQACSQLLAIKCDSAALRLRIALHRFIEVTRRTKFNPNQPRADNGQWIGDGGNGAIATTGPQVALGPLIGSEGLQRPFSLSDTTLVADKPVAQVSILDEDALGGHTYEKHVGKSDLYLLNRVKTETFRVLGVASIFATRWNLPFA